MSAAPDSAAGLRVAVGDDDHTLGPPDAPVTLVEYGDFQCPHCARAFPVVQGVKERLGDRVRFVFRHFPLTEIHPQALHAAQAAESAAALGGEEAFWAMHDALFQHAQESRTALSDRNLVRYAESAGVDPAQVARDLEAGAHEERVRADFMGGVRSGVNGTPTFFVNGVRFDGDWSDEEGFVAALERAAGAGARGGAS